MAANRHAGGAPATGIAGSGAAWPRPSENNGNSDGSAKASGRRPCFIAVEPDNSGLCRDVPLPEVL